MKQTINPRSCVACRKTDQPENMIRVVRAPDGSVWIDRDGKGQGRGAYVCKDERCIVLTCKKKLLDKALRCSVPADVYVSLAAEAGTETAGAGRTEDLLSLFGLARSGGNLTIGQDKIIEELKSGKRLAVFTASDASARFIESLRDRCRIVPVSADRERLGKALGLQSCQAVALEEDSGFARKAGDFLPEEGDVHIEHASI